MEKKFKYALLFLLMNIIMVSNFAYASEKRGEIITAELAEKMKSEDEFLDLMLYLKEDNIDSDNADEFIGKLYENALMSQEDILVYLEDEKEKGNVKEYKSFFIVNSIHLIAKENVIRHLAENGDIEKIDLNRTHKRDEPVPVKKPKRFKRSLDGLDWNLKNIYVDKAWELGAYGEGVTVGIMDSSIDIDHPALKRKFRGYDKSTGKIELKGNYFDAVEKKESYKDCVDHEHGTHCMGIILGSENDKDGNEYNQIGVAPRAKFISARVFDDRGYNTTDEFLEAAEWMMAPGGDKSKRPDIINNSWGGSEDPADIWFEKAVEKWIEAGIFPVFASGNQLPYEAAPGPGSISIPAAYKASYAVGAVDRYGHLAGFSKRGPSIFGFSDWKPEISAPGVLVRSSVENGYEYMSGTSMAAPHVSGVAALIKSAKPGITVEEMRDILNKTASPAIDNEYRESPNHGYGYGIVNAYNAVSDALGKGTGTITGKVMSADKVLSAKITIDGISVRTNETDGSFTLKHPEGKYTLECSAYGYKTFRKDIEIKKDETLEVFPDLLKKDLRDLHISVKDENGLAIENARAYLVESKELLFYSSDRCGKLLIKDIPEDSYSLRVFKKGYRCHEEKIEIKGEKSIEITLISDKKQEKELIKYDSENVNKLPQDNFPLTAQSKRSAAVLFNPSKKSGIIENVSACIIKNPQYANDKRLGISIKTMDDMGRIETLLPLTEFTFDKYGEYEEFSLLPYHISTDKPFYVLFTSVNGSSFTLGMDKETDQNNSYVCVGSNFDTVELYNNVNDLDHNLSGAFKIRAEISYPENVEDLENIVDKPSVNPIKPEELKVEGHAAPGQRIRLVVENKLRRLYTFSDENGDFSFKMKKEIKAGSKVHVYAKNRSGLSSEASILLSDNNISEISKLVSLIDDYIERIKDENLKKDLKDKKTIAEKLIKEANTYDNNESKTAEGIKEIQKRIDNTVKEIKEITITAEPEKKILKKKIEALKDVRDNVFIDRVSSTVPEGKFWIEEDEWKKLKFLIDEAIKAYETPGLSNDEIKDLEKKLDEIMDSYNKVWKKPGRMKMPIIDSEHYNDGVFEGYCEGHGKSKSKFIIEISDGRLSDIQSEKWFEGEEVLQDIIDDGYIDRIIKENSLSVLPTRLYEDECRYIRNAIIDALSKAKCGESIKEKREELEDLIITAKNDMEDVALSIDGSDIEDGGKWIEEKYLNSLKEAYNKSKIYLEGQKDLEEDEIDRLISEIKKSIREFENNIKISEEIIGDIEESLSNHIFMAKEAIYKVWVKKERKSFLGSWIDKAYRKKYIKAVKNAETVLEERDNTKLSKADKELIKIIKEINKK